MAPEKVTQLGWTPDRIDAFMPVAARNPWGGIESPGCMLQGSMLFEVRQGRQVALMAVRPVQLDEGVRAEVVGLVSEAPLFHASAMNAAAHMVAHQLGADVLAMCTQVPRLAKACQRHGWTITGAIVTKHLGH